MPEIKRLKTRVLDVDFDVITPAGAVERFLLFLKKGGQHTVFTPNPEMVMAARKDPAFAAILNAGDLVIPDGIGVVYASKLNKIKIKKRVTGYDLLQSVFSHVAKTGEKVYFFGGKQGVAEEAKAKMAAAHPGLKIVGTHHGECFDNPENETAILSDISRKKPDILLVGLGFPKQEKWIAAHKDALPVKIFAGVGGSLDVMAGRVPRAPKIFQKLGLEWLYRLMKQPSKRWRRQLALPVFAWTVIKEKTIGIFKRPKKNGG